MKQMIITKSDTETKVDLEGERNNLDMFHTIISLITMTVNEIQNTKQILSFVSDLFSASIEKLLSEGLLTPIEENQTYKDDKQGFEDELKERFKKEKPLFK